MSPEIAVRNVVGRYGRGALAPENIIATVEPVACIFRIRLDDAENPDAWMEIMIEVSDEVILGEKLDEAMAEEIPF